MIKEKIVNLFKHLQRKENNKLFFMMRLLKEIYEIIKYWTCIDLVSIDHKRTTHSQASLRDGKTLGTNNMEDVRNLHLEYKQKI